MDTEPTVSCEVLIDPLLPSTASRSVTDLDVGLLYRDHRARLVALASAITMDRAIAEEVVHDAFVGLQRHAGRIDAPLPYLQRSVVNRGVTLIRRRRVAAAYPLRPSSPASSPEVDETWSVVVRLPPKQRAVIALRFWEDMSVDTIAATLGWPAGSVKSTLHRALKRLKEELQ